MTDLSILTTDDFIRRGFVAAESPVGGEYLRMWLRAALERLEIADSIAEELRRVMEESDAIYNSAYEGEDAA